uniref:Helicase C-terminal domain-containing protein n=1 Tax=Salix viminalis TaxID=40686 RepID=A0A6N2LV08_SALVM
MERNTAIVFKVKNCKGVEIEKIPFSTLNIIQRLSKSFDAGRWEPCRPEHFTDEKVDEFIRMLPRKLLDALLPFQLDGLRFGLRRGGRCLIADEMGLGKTLQEFVCEKGVGFVRIDGNTLASDRQNAVSSFQSSDKVKIAIISITAGGVGLDFSSAQNVVFLELPQSPSLMLQAEDRAHRRGQSNAVNIYIFCAKVSFLSKEMLLVVKTFMSLLYAYKDFCYIAGHFGRNTLAKFKQEFASCLIYYGWKI